MKRTETLALLTKLAAYDQRTIGEADVEAWHEVLPDEIGIADALASVPVHYARSRDRMMPADVIDAVTAVRRDRLQKAGTPPIPGDLTWRQEKTWRTLWCDNVKDGMSITEAADMASDELNLPKELPASTSESVAEERKALVQKLADSKAAPKAKPQDFNPKPKKPRTRWGSWSRGDYIPETPDDEGYIEFHPGGRVLYHDLGPYGINIDTLQGDLKFWLHHIAGKGWGDSATLTQLARAWAHITDATDDQYATAIVWVSEAIDQEREDETYDATLTTHPADNRTEQQQW